MPVRLVVRSIPAAMLVAAVSACATSAPPAEQTAGAPAGDWCQVDVRNATQFTLDTSYWLGPRGTGAMHPVGMLDPDQSTMFGVPCAQERLQVSGVAVSVFGASLDRGQARGFAVADLEPGKTAMVVLRAR